MAEKDSAATARAKVDAYLANLPPEQRAALQSLRTTIAATIPDAEEAISYGIPAFKYRSRAIVWYLGAKKHCSLFPIPEGFREELAGYDLGKGTIRFTPDRPLGSDLVKRIVRARMAAVDEGERYGSPS